MSVRIFLPPNLSVTASRDAIAIKIDYTGDLPPVLSDFAGKESPVFTQFTRERLQQVLAGLVGQPCFFWINRAHHALPWENQLLPGVSEHLVGAKPNVVEPKSAAATSREDYIKKKLQGSRPKFEARPMPVAPRAGSAGSRAKAPGLATTASPVDRVAAVRMIVDGSEHFLAISLPSREDFRYNEIVDLLKTEGFNLEPSNRKWWLRDRHRTLNFIAKYGEKLSSYFSAEFTPAFEKNTARLKTAEISINVAAAVDGFDVALSLRAGTADETQLRQAIASGCHYLEAGGNLHLIDPKSLEKLTAAHKALASDTAAGATHRRTHRLPYARLAEAQSLLEEISPGFQPPEAWRARSNALRNLSALDQAPVPAEFDAKLRLYQRIGVAWLWHLHRHNLGGVLADEMGLGKTLQALGLLASIKVARQKGHVPAPSLVVCPASLVENWRREAGKFAPELRLFVHHGTARLNNAEELASHDIIVTSYGTLARDKAVFASVEFACVIADEAQHIKNRRTQNAQALRALHASSRFLLTGTPVENSLEDLRSLFEFLLPGYLPQIPPQQKREDKAWFEGRLRAQTAPYLLRRTKLQVAPELPDKIEQVLYCELSPAQAKLYREIQEKTERDLYALETKGANENALRMAALTQLLRLRQVCCDPRLVAPEAEPESSAKLEAFRELISEAVDDGHRLLVFSQFTSLLTLLSQELEAQDLTHCYLDGSMSPKARQAEVDKFNQNADIPLFLISLKAGGTGLNLTGADTVVHYDPWWNPAAEAQATDRAHRIGQTRTVTSYKLICTGTVEEKVLALQAKKRALLADVFEASDAVNAKLSLADLKSLLQ